ncbi:MAG: hypothetical protein HYV63_15170 [Candidatus Schekmanbacteria bacterium]|nr:hypothetical protein [Candidatus Schekmanbacteria bacterium]
MPTTKRCYCGCDLDDLEEGAEGDETAAGGRGSDAKWPLRYYPWGLMSARRYAFGSLRTYLTGFAVFLPLNVAIAALAVLAEPDLRLLLGALGPVLVGVGMALILPITLVTADRYSRRQRGGRAAFLRAVVTSIPRGAVGLVAYALRCAGGTVLLVGPGAVWALRYRFVFHAAVLDGASVRDAFALSARHSADRSFSLFVRTLTVQLFFAMFTVIAGLFVAVPLGLASMRGTLPGAWGRYLQDLALALRPLRDIPYAATAAEGLVAGFLILLYVIFEAILYRSLQLEES